MSQSESDMVQPPVKVLFIVGYPRSGTTLLGMLLNELPGFLFVGELAFFWEAHLRGTLCGCDNSVQECEMWSRVVRTWCTDTTPIRQLVDLQSQDGAKCQTFHLAETLRKSLPGSRSQLWNLWQIKKLSLESAQFGLYLELVSKLYSSISVATGSAVIVDSSKSPVDAAVAGLAPGIEPYFTHMIRSPQGVICSHLKKREHLPWLQRQRKPVLVHHALAWSETNTAIDIGLQAYMTNRSLRIVYEDLASSPRAVLGKAAELVGQPSGGFDFLRGNTAFLKRNHSVRGNRIRSVAGSLPIRVDTAWMAGSTKFEQLLVESLTLPLVRKYGLSQASRAYDAACLDGDAEQ
jgi:hypothetical protein